MSEFWLGVACGWLGGILLAGWRVLAWRRIALAKTKTAREWEQALAEALLLILRMDGLIEALRKYYPGRKA